ncbi:YcaO-like family protein [Riemerella anatipestifer]|uniref:YcaO-like family protein n=1 Tax=Riemerella anatipestifer TaxID=34085 RepID=UPI0021A46510|nr:YcaO-like family protein [Riemerella anatipestifer]MCT6745079.1 YcaO-like family protein [Riemerella anatipestifer]MCU7572329.1 YcaO-like family protein [Riemerella anatipestifer]MCU7597085.1 YcaO-like family protein [Riemerella anatipestifer]MCU7603711.1 YcaO-like family protein [Riemerella anatipestifer]MCW0493747.1 YcaO-like family protein [Riemerella anatipestifer]
MRVQSNISQIQRAIDLISDQIGIVQNIGKSAMFNSDPRVIGYAAFNCQTERLGAESYAGLSGGCGFDWESAFLSAIGECVERYSPAFYDEKTLLESSYNDLVNKEFNAIEPHKFALFHKQQYAEEKFPFVEFNKETIVHWVETYDLINNKKILCPASFIYMPFKKDKNNISEQISTGYGAHSDYNKALLNALFEVIERDSFMISWMNLLDIPKIKIDKELKCFVDDILPSHFELHLFDMTTDIKVPSVFGILKGSHDFGDFIAFSAATRITYKEAIKKTILELCQSVPYFRFLLEENKNRFFNDYSEIRTFQDHSVFYTKRKDKWEIFDRWLNKVPDMSIDFMDGKKFLEEEVIEYIKEQFREKGYNILVKDITTEDVYKSGFKVIRVVCPELIHLNGTYGQYYLGGNRLYKTPKKMGYLEKSFSELNLMPHPFP